MTGVRAVCVPTARALTAAGLVALTVPALAGCTAASSDCEQGLESAALGVPGVVAAEFTCTGDVVDPDQDGTVTLDAATPDEARAILDEILRAYAASDLDGGLVPDADYATGDGAIDVNPSDLGFNGTQSLHQLRAHYGTPQRR